MRLLRLLVLLALFAPALIARAQEPAPLPLTATYTSADGALTFDHPNGWVTIDLGLSAALATDEAALEINTDLAEGQMRAAVYAAPLAALPDLGPGASLEDMLALVISVTGASDTCEPYSNPVELDVDGRDAIRADQTCSDTDNVIIIADAGNGTVAVIAASTLTGGLDDFIPTLAAIAATVELNLTAPTPDGNAATNMSELTQSFTSADGRVTFSYPEGWRVEEAGVLIGLTDGDAPLFPDPPSNQRLILIDAFRADEIPSDYQGAGATGVVRWLADTSRLPVSYSEPVAFDISGQAAARAMLETSSVDSMLVAVELPGGFGVLNTRFNTGDLVELEPLLYTIATTIRLSDTSSASSAVGIDTSDIELGALFVSDDGVLSFRYPDTWTLHDETINGQRAFVLTNQSDWSFEPPEPGQVVAIFYLGRLQTVLESAPASPEQAPVAVLEQFNAGTPGMFNDPVGLLVDGRPAARSDALLPDADVSAFVLMIDESSFAYFNAAAASGELPGYEPTLFAILASVRLDFAALNDPPVTATEPSSADPTQAATTTTPTPPPPLAIPDVDLPETYTAPNDAFSLNYPANWRTDGIGNLLILSGGGVSITLSIVTPPAGEPNTPEATLTEQVGGDGVDPFTLNGQPAARALLGPGESAFALQLAEGTLATVTVFYPPQERADVEPLVAAILASLRYSGD